MNERRNTGVGSRERFPVSRLLFGTDRRASYLFSTVGFVVGFLVPLEMALFGALDVQPGAVHGALVHLVSVGVVAAAILNAYRGGGLLVSVGAVLFVPLRILLGHHLLQGNAVTAAPGSVAAAPTLVGVSLVAGLSAYAAGAMADQRVRRAR